MPFFAPKPRVILPGKPKSKVKSSTRSSQGLGMAQPLPAKSKQILPPKKSLAGRDLFYSIKSKRR